MTTRIEPAPTEEEAAAIAAALSLLTAGSAEEGAPAAPARWRFSGRWWTKPIPLVRARP